MSSIDIAVPCYQYGRYLPECVASVLGQGIEDVRILIIDNASTDDSVMIARKLAEQDARVQVLARARNMGPHASFNAGVDWAAADYFMVLCADDLLAPGALRRASQVLDANPDLSFAYGTDRHVVPDTPLPELDSKVPVRWQLCSGKDFIRDRCRNPEHYIAAGMVLVRTSAQKQAGHYRPELPHTDDFEMLLRLACHGGVAFTAAVLGFKRVHGANRTNDYLVDRTTDLAERMAAIDSFLAYEGRDMPEAAWLRRRARKSLAERAYWCGVKDLLLRRRTHRELFHFAFKLDASTRLLPPVGYFLRMDRSIRAILGDFMPHAVKSGTGN
ncbi:Glycosyl transferase, group 2 family protein (plasmid) [Rhodovastum atsumiense]|uniref:glycosyltransferase family 2 protein n=1 Tax=Rhodovastum atsumiense TaxID=504468 RepID=UPI002025231B|nr:glycosyltransferase family 2 protein [Rhodovastum atsumiense]CAH2605549.1 Glycosyl transferase, group 2 family protein [Rhodovastum atsumiense]